MPDLDFIPPPPPPEIVPAPQPAPDPQRPAWGLLDVFLVTLFFVVVSTMVGLIGVFGARLVPSLRHASFDALAKDVRLAVPIQVAAYVFLLVAMAVIVSLRSRDPFWQSISWNPPERKRLWTAVAVGFALAAFSALAETLMSRWMPQSTPMDEYFRDTLSAYLLAGFGILVAPPVEELYFRGFLYPALARWTGVAPAVMITSAGFAMLHGAQLGHAVVPLLIIFMTGVVLNVVRVRTGSVATGVIVHMTYNFVLFFMTFIGTGGFRHFPKH